MNAEKRTIKASILAGITDIIFGLIMYFSGWSTWYFNHFHFFGIMGFGMLAFGFWNIFFYNIETGGTVWK